jgi:hypothetical protein
LENPSFSRKNGQQGWLFTASYWQGFPQAVDDKLCRGLQKPITSSLKARFCEEALKKLQLAPLANAGCEGYSLGISSGLLKTWQ